VVVQLVRALPLVHEGSRLERHILFVDACVRAYRGIPRRPLQDLVALLPRPETALPGNGV
jgi:hypothetical protein